MSTPKLEDSPFNLGGFSLRLGIPEIRRALFERIADQVEGEAEYEYRLDLSVNRSGRNRVVVELTAESHDSNAVEFRVTCRLGMEVHPVEEADQDFDYDTVLRDVSVRIGPVVAYPYIRELISNLSQRSGIDPVVLPVMNMGAVFDPASMVLPPFTQPSSENESEAVEEN
jgi:preprotein translocase subunit SecB